MFQILLLLAFTGLALGNPEADAKPDAEAAPEAKADADPKSDSKAKSSYYGSQPHYGGSHTASLPPYSGYGAPPQPYQPAHGPTYKPVGQHGHYEPAPVHHGYKEEVVVLEETYPKQNCTVQDEALRAEICVPDFQTKCDEEKLMSKRIETGEFCYDVTRTECTMVERTEEIEVCDFEMERQEASAKAKTVEVEFKQECSTQMVTVCEPVTYQPPPPPPTYAPYGHHGGYHQPAPAPQPKQVYQQCKEVAQETCYNIPQVIEKEIDVTMGFPKPSKDCSKQTVTLPEIKCEDLVETKCQNIPRIVDEPDNIERCEVVVGPPKCSEVELVLPKQVCQDIVYGFTAEEPKYEAPPQQVYVEQPSYHAPQPAYHAPQDDYQPAPYQHVKK